MEETTIYDRIAESIRQEILNGTLKPGDKLPSVRKIAQQWSCTIGTAQHAYQVLNRQGLVTSRPGQGTRITESAQPSDLIPLRRLQLAHRAEAFLLESLSTGYSLQEIDTALQQAMDRWRATERLPKPSTPQVIRFSGSHDPVIAWMASRFPEIVPDSTLELEFIGSLSGLMALAAGEADFAGSHLWDEETDTYNIPFIRKLFPNQKMALITLAHRSLGLILAKGNPHQIEGLHHLTNLDLHIANRQPGSGTRVWLDAMLQREKIPLEQISQQSVEYLTHTAVAQAVAEGKADVGIGLQAAANSFAIAFIPLTLERYDLIMPEVTYHRPAIQWMIRWLHEPTVLGWIQRFRGYDTRETGQITWI
jgi:molybdate-binding protein/DNA-binding transcriptional regulator YhcF (GntR family)